MQYLEVIQKDAIERLEKIREELNVISKAEENIKSLGCNVDLKISITV